MNVRHSVSYISFSIKNIFYDKMDWLFNFLSDNMYLGANGAMFSFTPFNYFISFLNFRDNFQIFCIVAKIISIKG